MTEKGAAERIGRLLGRRSLATAESATAGLIAQSFAAAEGSMDWFRGGIVAYQSGVKRALLDVSPGPVVTEQTAREMAWGATRMFDADVAVSVTGVAGPEPLDGVEPGVVIIGVAIGNRAQSFVHHFCGDPPTVCADAARAALDDLARCLESDDSRATT